MRVGPLVVSLLLLQASAALAAKPAAKASAPPAAKPIGFPAGEGGIGFDDLGYSYAAGKLLVPAGGTGRLNLVDPASGGLVSIPGFSVVQGYDGGHDDGVTSATDGAGLMFATDRTARALSIVYYPSRKILGRAALAASPDYVRWVEAGREVWVTEPDSQWIEVFRLEPTRPPSLTFLTRIVVSGGPESLLLDPVRGRAYTQAGERTAVIDLRTHAIVASFAHGCRTAKGMALDGPGGFLFVACEDGAVTTLEAGTGRHLSTFKVLGAGLDIIAYSPELNHLYVPSREPAELTILAVSKEGGLKRLGAVPASGDPRCVAAAGKVFYSDPAHGRLMMVADPFPANPH